MAIVNVIDPLLVLWASLVNALPGIAAAVIIIIIGYLVALLLGYLVKEILLRTGFDRWLTKSRLNKAIGGASLSVIIGTLTKWWIFVAFLAPAARLLQLGEISDLLVRLVNWLPNLFVAVIIFLFGLIVAYYAADLVRHKKAQGAQLFADIIQWVTVVFVLIVALGQLGVRVSFAENIFLVIIGGIVIALGLAIGISFGYAFRDDAKAIIRRFRYMK